MLSDKLPPVTSLSGSLDAIYRYEGVKTSMLSQSHTGRIQIRDTQAMRGSNFFKKQHNEPDQLLRTTGNESGSQGAHQGWRTGTGSTQAKVQTKLRRG